uniref:G_PROTEIN_RECEP_F1_2 domain-containing protein n=1 Tax=Panagrellus redivivus TaxID=6233 RepID=A0A7E4VQQ5_PANRE
MEVTTSNLHGLGLVQLLLPLHDHSLDEPWYVTFYYDPSAYGMSAEDYPKYLTQGQSLFFLITHVITMIIPIGFYIYAIVFLLKHRNGAKPTSKAMSVEAKLLLPCIFNTVIFIIGQVVITIGTGSGKWATWMVLILFTCNAAFNPFLLILFSGVIR